MYLMGRTILRNITICLLLVASSKAFALKHITEDPEAQNKVEWVLKAVYNYEFNTARQRLKYFDAEYKDHPVYPLLESRIINFSLYKSKDLAADEALYLEKLDKALEYAKVFLKEDKNDPEGTFFSLAAYGFLTLYNSENNEFIKAAGVAKKAWSHMKDGFDLEEKYPEFNFSSGLYNYFVVEYPKTHPIIIPVTAFFPGGDKKHGIQQLVIASKEGKFTKYEALYFIGHIYGKYEANQGQAIRYFGKLVRMFPRNIYYKIRYAESLLSAQQADEAKPYIDEIMTCGYQNYTDLGWVLYSIYLEYKADYNDSKKYALKGITSIMSGNKYGEEYLYFAYAALARAALDQNDPETAKKHYKKISHNTEYKALRDEAKDYLKND